MTETERTALLTRVAECAPEEWEATIPRDGIMFMHRGSRCLDVRLKDMNADEALFVFMALHHLEEKGFQYSISRYDDPADPGKYHMSIGPLNDTWGYERESFSGDSESEVVALAFVAACAALGEK